ncbi:methyltransferase domain protein [Oesophagostomum dentatum]|uniref:Methyltransferase domain protein n=1 Tax=Oesophagostomum dentatum TaxID=61180 RepID=A0A0B1T6Y6_OESDE|nr:methyltransferase domain protein [Oesophagostomum dentatum]
MISVCIALGNRLHLFDALAKVGSEEKPATAAQDLSTSAGVVSHSFLTAFMKPYEKLCSVFKKDGPYGFEHTDIAPEFHDVMAKFSETRHKKYFITDFVPALGADERLEKGDMECLDIGCGKGFHISLLGNTFPKSHFVGIDISAEAIKRAKELKKSGGKKYENLSFFEMDALKLDPAWTNKFDLVTNIDACHGQMRPDLGLKEIHRVLKPGGILGLLEVMEFLYSTSK